MKVIILAGGFGTRLSEYTESIPKPMVTVGNRPILWHIMATYASYDYDDFYIALGYKANLVKEYFLNYYEVNSDFTVNLSDGSVTSHQQDEVNWNVTLVDTGIDSMTGGRIKRLKKFINDETFMLTYGDGLSNVNLNLLLKFHKKNKNVATLTAVRPPARFGAIKVNGSKVVYFKEKSNLDEGWINGGFFVFDHKIFDYLKNDNTYLERDPMQIISKKRMLGAFKHKGFWQCMDTLRDKEILEKKLKKLKKYEM